MTNPQTPVCLPHCYQDQQQSVRHQQMNEMFHQSSTNQCNGFVKIPCPCSSIGGVASIDDESVSIPTPPPAVTSGYPRDCPVHYQHLVERSSYVTVHSPATGASSSTAAPLLSTIRRHQNYQKQQSQERDMPDITAFSRMLVHDRRQFSTDSENSNYKVTGGNGQPPAVVLQHQQTTICYQCHGAGHVTVPVISADNNGRQMPPSYAGNSLPRDMTTSTICSAAVTSPGDDEFGPQPVTHHRSRDNDDEAVIFHRGHQRSHSSGTNYDGSLRRITAV
jgi:hypothetical protein